MKVSTRYGYASHLPVLMKLVEMTNGPILETGVGLYSTPYLHYACLPRKRSLTSYENSAEWIGHFQDNQSDYHQINLIEDWNALPINQFWDVAFLDHGPDPTRKDVAKNLRNNAKYIVLHDSDPENDYLYKFSEIYPLFKYRFDYALGAPNTTVLSNFVALDKLL